MTRTVVEIETALSELEDGASHARGRALRLLGLARRDAGDIEAAVDAHTKAEYVFAVLGDPRAQAREGPQRPINRTHRGTPSAAIRK